MLRVPVTFTNGLSLRLYLSVAVQGRGATQQFFYKLFRQKYTELLIVLIDSFILKKCLLNSLWEETVHVYMTGKEYFDSLTSVNDTPPKRLSIAVIERTPYYHYLAL